MSRVLEVAKLAGMQVGPGSFSVQLRDPLCAWNRGIWHFGSWEGCLSVSQAGRAECSLSIQGLSALIAGVSDPQDLEFRGWGTPGTAVQSWMRAMIPFLHENF